MTVVRGFHRSLVTSQDGAQQRNIGLKANFLNLDLSSYFTLLMQDVQSVHQQGITFLLTSGHCCLLENQAQARL